MKIFYSWSGEKSRNAAQALAEFTPLVLQTAQPFLPQATPPLSDRWQASLSSVLRGADAAIVCLTRENTNNPWVAFEAGALSGKLPPNRFFPLLVDFSVRELAGPLAQFQTISLERSDLLRMFQTLNSIAELPAPSSVIEDLFVRLWPRLADKLRTFHERDLETAAKPDDPTPESILQKLKELEEKLEKVSRKLKEID